MLLKGNYGGEGDPTPWKVTYLTERSTEPEESPDAEKSVAVSQSSEKQSENRTDHLNYGHSHQKLRRLGGGWAPIPRLWRLVPGKGIGRWGGAETAWETRKQSIAGGGSNTLREEKWKAISEGTWEKSWDCASVGEGREEGVGPQRILPMPQRAYWPTS